MSTGTYDCVILDAQGNFIDGTKFEDLVLFGWSHCVYRVLRRGGRQV